ncbi:ATP-binding protein [Hypericibacter adhaerens]
MRQPLETGRVTVARAAAHVTYPARFQLIAAMNPCRCGHLGDGSRACGRQPRCGQDYQARLSGPLLDRIDLAIEVPAVSPADLTLPPSAERSTDVAKRVAAARAFHRARVEQLMSEANAPTLPPPRCNAELDGGWLEALASPDSEGRKLLAQAIERFHLSARGYHRILKLARSLADLEAEPQIRRVHIAEALSYRQMQAGL